VKMGIFQNLRQRFTQGTLNKETMQVSWTESSAKYTSTFMMSVNAFVAREFSKLDIDHRIFKKTGDKYLVTDKLGSDIFEVLNFSPNGYRNNTEWKREIVKRLMSGIPVYLFPKRSNGRLESLTFTSVEEYQKHPDDIIVLTSPIHVSTNATLYDNILTSIGRQLSTNDVKAYLKVNANIKSIDSDGSAFVAEAKKQLKMFQEVGSYNGIGIIDGKADLVELNNTYSSLPQESIDIIKREILNGYGFSEKLLTGEYTETDYKNFFNNVLKPIVKEFENELTYKLLTTNARVNTGDKNSFERIFVSSDLMKFATVSELIKLSESNTNGAFLTVNEIRQLMGFDPIDGGDVFRTNLNSQEISYDKNNEVKNES
jgi:putative portal protein